MRLHSKVVAALGGVFFVAAAAYGYKAYNGWQITDRILPGQTLATLIPGQPGKSRLMSKISISLAAPARQGQLLLNLREVGPDGRPGPHNLLPEPAKYGTAQLKAGDELFLPMTAYNLQVPAQGLYLLVQCLPTVASDRVVALTEAKSAVDSPRISVVLASRTEAANAPNHVVPGDSFPGLLSRYGGYKQSKAYFKLDSGGTWLQKTPAPSLEINVEYQP